MTASSCANADLIEIYASQIEHSQLLISIIVEGKDDLIVYKQLEEKFPNCTKIIDVLPVGCRNNVLGIFNKLKNTVHINKAVFIVDKDLWTITGIPLSYQHPRIITTLGYSIENDIYVDGNLDQYVTAKNPITFQSELISCLTWYSLEIYRVMNNKPTLKISLEMPELFDQPGGLNHKYTTPQVGEVFPYLIFNNLTLMYNFVLRGKALMSLYIRALNARPGFCNQYKIKAEMEKVASNPGTCLNRISNEVEALVI